MKTTTGYPNKAADNTSSRSSWVRTVAIEWVRQNRPDVWEKIYAAADKKFPRSTNRKPRDPQIQKLLLELGG